MSRGRCEARSATGISSNCLRRRTGVKGGRNVDEGIPSSRSQGSEIYRVLEAWRRETRGYLHASHDSIALKPPRMGYVPFHGCLASSRFPTLPPTARNLRSASKQLWSVGCIRAGRPLAHGWWPLQRSTRRTERFTREVTRVAVKIRQTGDEKKKFSRAASDVGPAICRFPCMRWRPRGAPGPIGTNFKAHQPALAESFGG